MKAKKNPTGDRAEILVVEDGPTQAKQLRRLREQPRYGVTVDTLVTKPFGTDHLLAHIQQILANWKLRKGDRGRLRVESLFAGIRRFISADQQQMLRLLLSTYEAAVHRNAELAKAQNELRSLNEQLEERVAERTAALSAEIAVRKQSEEALRESNAFNTILLQTIPVGIGIVDEAGQTLFFSPSLEKALGKNALGARCWDLYKDDKQQCAGCPLKQRIEMGVNKTLETTGVLGGKIFEINHTGIVFRGKQALLEVFYDITERKHAEWEIARRADEFAALYETSRDLVSQQDLSALLETIVERATQLLAAPRGLIYLYDATANDLELVVEKGALLPPGARLAMNEGLAGRVAFEREPMIVDNYGAWEGHAAQDEGLPVAAALEVPMLYGGEVIGVLGVTEVGTATRRFDEADARLLSVFASQAAGAVHNARLLEETSMHAEQLGTLYDAGLTLNRVLDQRVQLKFLLQLATRALRAERAEFFRFNAAHDEMQFEIGIGYSEATEHRMHEMRLPVGEERGLVGWVAEKRVHLNLPDVSADPRWVSVDPEIRSALWAPVQHEKKLLGVLAVSSTRVKAFTPHDERLLVLFGNQVAVAMENARLFSTERARSKELAALCFLSRVLAETDDFKEILSLAARHLVESCQVTFVHTLLVEGDEFVVHAACPVRVIQHDLPIGQREPVAALPFCQRALEQSDSIIVHATDPDITDAEREFLFQGTAQLVCLVPLRVGENQRGLWILGEARKEEREPITAEKLRLANSISEQVAGALQGAKLLERTKRQLSQLQSLHTIDMAITGSFNLHLTLSIFLEQVIPQLRVDAGSILLLNPHTGMLEHAAGRGFRTRAVERSHLRLGEGAAGRAALEKRTLHIADLRADAASFARTQLLAGEEFVSYYGVPLIAKGEVKGVLDIFQRSPLNGDAEWLGFMEALASQAAIAVDNATLFGDLKQSNVELTQAYDLTIVGWSRALDLRDKETEGHTQRVTEMALQLARVMGTSEEDLGYVRRGALLHDIGKMGVPDAILHKPGKLADEEWDIMRRHPTYAYEMLSPITYLQLALDIPHCHHEKWDGTGYPRGLKGEQIPLAARIFAVADVWDALRSDRPYRKAWDQEKVRAHVLAGCGTHFDPKVVEVFQEIVH